MNKIYCIGSIYNKIELLDNFIKECDSSDVIYLLGNFSVCSYQQQSQVTYVYLYNLVQQKINNKNVPNIKLIKGKNESINNLRIKDFNELTISTAYQYIKNMYPNSIFDNTVEKPNPQILFNFINDLNLLVKKDNFVLLSGYYNLHLDDNQQILKANTDMDKGLLYGSIGKINLYYYEFCKQNKFRIWSKKSLELFNQNSINYDGYKTIDEYNQDLKNNNLIVVCGNWYDPTFKKNLNIAKWSNLYMIDGGLNRSLNNEKQWFYYEQNEEKFNILDITDLNNIKEIFNINFIN